MAWPSSSIRWSHSAFSAFGRFSRMIATRPWVSVRIISYSAMAASVALARNLSPLRPRAMEGGPAGLDEAADALAGAPGGAGRGHTGAMVAGLSRAVVDLEAFLEE